MRYAIPKLGFASNAVQSIPVPKAKYAAMKDFASPGNVLCYPHAMTTESAIQPINALTPLNCIMIAIFTKTAAHVKKHTTNAWTNATMQLPFSNRIWPIARQSETIAQATIRPVRQIKQTATIVRRIPMRHSSDPVKMGNAAAKK